VNNCPECKPSNLTIHGEKQLREKLALATTEGALKDELVAVVRAELKKAHCPHADSNISVITAYPVRNALTRLDAAVSSRQPK